MKVTVRVTLAADADAPTVVNEVFTLERGPLAPDTLGLQLDEAKSLLRPERDRRRAGQGCPRGPGRLPVLRQGPPAQRRPGFTHTPQEADIAA